MLWPCLAKLAVEQADSWLGSRQRLQLSCQQMARRFNQLFQKKKIAFGYGEVINIKGQKGAWTVIGIVAITAAAAILLLVITSTAISTTIQKSMVIDHAVSPN